MEVDPPPTRPPPGPPLLTAEQEGLLLTLQECQAISEEANRSAIVQLFPSEDEKNSVLENLEKINQNALFLMQSVRRIIKPDEIHGILKWLLNLYNQANNPEHIDLKKLSYPITSITFFLDGLTTSLISSKRVVAFLASLLIIFSI